MKRLLTDLAQTVGLTVTEVLVYSDAAVIHFTDGTALLLCTNRDDDVIEVSTDINPAGGSIVPLGLSTREEWVAAVDAKRAAWDAKKDKNDRAEYERLRAKFGGGK